MHEFESVGCPVCHTAVVKDDACTQMSCQCGHKWCYVCEGDLGSDADIHGETSHRIESPDCPLMLEMFHESQDGLSARMDATLFKKDSKRLQGILHKHCIITDRSLSSFPKLRQSAMQ